MTIDARVLRVLTKLFSSGWTWATLVVLTGAGIFLWEFFNQDIMAQHINPSLWVMTNLLWFFGYAALAFYVLIYGLVFNWNTLPNGEANTGGRLIFSLTTSLGGVVGLLLLQIFLVPTSGRAWYEAPESPVFWLPTLRFIVYSAVVVTVVVMDATLINRIIKSQPLDISVPARQIREPGLD